MSPPPWTLFWPRSGLRPLPHRPTCPHSSERLISARTLSTALWCSVMPSVQQIIALLGGRVGVGGLADRRRGDAGDALRALQRPRLHGGPVRLEPAGGAPDELLVREARGDDLAAHRVRQRDVGAHVQAQPQVGPLRGRGAARVHGVQPGTVAHPLQEVVEEDRVRLPGVAAPQEDDVRLLDLTI